MKVGLSGTALEWFQSNCLDVPSKFLSVDRCRKSLICALGFHKVPVLDHFSSQYMLVCCLMSLKTTFLVHCYADNTQLYLLFSPKEHDAVVAVEHCTQDIRRWMSQEKLLMNDVKTELILIGTRQQLA